MDTLMNIIVTTTSEVKLDSIRDFLKEEKLGIFTVNAYDCNGCNLPPQPFGLKSIVACAKERINYLKKNIPVTYFDYIVSVENGLMEQDSKIYDVCVVVIEYKGVLVYENSMFVKIPSMDYFDTLQTKNKIQYNKKISGFDTTLGKIIQEKNNDIDHRNWMKVLCGVDRKDMIKDALRKTFKKLPLKIEKANVINNAFKVYDNFKPGVKFEDIWPIFKNPKIFHNMISLLKDLYEHDDIDYIVGLEMRGVAIGLPLAYKMNIGFIPARKQNTLPGEVVRQSYGKEYGVDVIEIQKDIPEGSKVLIVDDIIATGGSLNAVVTLLTDLKCQIVDCIVIKQIKELKDKADNLLKSRYSVLL